MTNLREQLRDLGIDLPAGASVESLLRVLEAAPAKATLGVVATAAIAFYQAERRYNPKVADIYDALLYCATCLSVGYAEVHPRTPVGKLIGTALQMYGPALAAKSLNALERRSEGSMGSRN